MATLVFNELRLSTFYKIDDFHHGCKNLIEEIFWLKLPIHYIDIPVLTNLVIILS